MDTSFVQAAIFTGFNLSKKAASYPPIESLRNDDDGGNKNGKKAIG